MELTEQFCHIHIIVKSHDGERGPEESHSRDECCFKDMPCHWRSLLIFIGHNDICFAHVLNLDPRIFFMDPFYDFQD